MVNQFVPPNGLPSDTPVGGTGNTLGDVVAQAAGAVQAAGGDASEAVVTPESGSNSVTLGRLSGSRRNFAAYGATSDGSATETALAAVATGLDPIGKTSVVIPSGDGFSLGYDQAQAQNAGMGIFLSDAPKNTGTNKRRQAVNPSWGSPYMFGPTVHASDLPNFTAACNAGAATVMIMGDSIFNAGANLANPQQCPWEMVLSEIKKANPTVTLTDWNMTWGGQKWSQMASSTNGSQVPKWIIGSDGSTSWLQVCLNAKPNLVFLYSGGNDEDGLNPADVVTVVNAFKSINCDVILCETYQPSTGSAVNNYYLESVQDGVHFSRRFITTYAQANGIPYLPFGRWGDMIRDGFDPDLIAMPENNPVAGTAYPARYTPVPDNALASNGSTYNFPDIKNQLGVSAALCTDWCIGATHTGIDADEIAWRVNLSAATTHNYDNSLWLFFNGTNIQFQITDGAGGKKTIDTNVPVPRSKWSFWIMARGSHLVFAMRIHYTSGGLENSIGLGYTKILDICVPRCGSPYIPYINAVKVPFTGGKLSIDALCAADATRADGGGLRYRPSTNNRALYYDTEILESTDVTWQPNAGGSDSYHMNGFGVRDLLYPVIAAQDWRATTGLTTTANNINAPQGWLQVNDAIKTTGYLASSDYIIAANSVTCWGASALDSQPTISLTNPTANETAIANALVSYGLIKLG